MKVCSVAVTEALQKKALQLSVADLATQALSLHVSEIELMQILSDTSPRYFPRHYADTSLSAPCETFALTHGCVINMCLVWIMSQPQTSPEAPSPNVGLAFAMTPNFQSEMENKLSQHQSDPPDALPTEPADLDWTL